MQIEMIKVSDLKAYARNTKKHSKEQIEKLAKMIHEFGFSVPLIVDAKNEIIAGHCRLESAKLLGMIEVPCVRKADLSPAQVKALRIADNKIAESEWDMGYLREELDWLKDLDFDLSLTGWGELPDFNDLSEKHDKQIQNDEQEFLIVITCEDEQQQKELFERLEKENYKCKLIG